MIESLYGKYFQKSKSFLYPVLGIKRTANFSPTGTYIAIEGIIEAEDCKLICAFKSDPSQGFKLFEESMLLGNPLFSKVLNIRDYNLYVFDYHTYAEDWLKFLDGKYSKLSTPLKKAIKVFYGDASTEYKYMESYLYPEKYYEIYARLLNVDRKLLLEVGELCSPYDPEQEQLKIPVEDLAILKKLT